MNLRSLMAASVAVLLAWSAVQGDTGTGTGFIVDGRGYVLTCHHVIDGAESIEVALGEEQKWTAAIVTEDQANDLALLKVEAEGLPGVDIGNSNTVARQDEVWVLGFPLGTILGSEITTTSGHVTAIRTVEGKRVIQVDAPVNPGNSGGPLVNDRAEVVGVVNRKVAHELVEGIGFGVPISFATPLLANVPDFDFASVGKQEETLGAHEIDRRVGPCVVLITTTQPAPPPDRAGQVSPELVGTLRGHLDFVNSVAFSPDGKVLASACKDGTTKVWSVKDRACVKSLPAHSMDAYCVAFAPDGSLLASSSADRTAKLWSVSTWECVRTLTGHSKAKGWVFSVAFTPDGELLVSGSGDRTIKVWAVSSGACLQTLAGHAHAVYGLAFSPDGTLLASAADDGTVKLWSRTSWECVSTLDVCPRHRVWSLAFNPDGSLLATSSHEGSVKLWSVRDGTCVKELAIGCRSSSLAFSPDGSLLAVRADTNSIALWCPDSGECVKTLEGHHDLVTSVAFSPDGTLLASSSWDATVKLWDVSNVRGNGGRGGPGAG